MADEATRQDAARVPLKALLYWGVPIALLLVGGAVVDEVAEVTALWTFCFGWMGAACLVNARTCGRRHCFVTGPFFLLIALAGLLHGTGLVILGKDGFDTLGTIALVGGIALWILPDLIWGRYVRRRG